nr:ribonuclease J [uncultured Ligilactobacillus sp.]
MSEIKLDVLSGVRENGKNMYAVEVDDKIFILDCGLMYPENELLGIDIVIPNFDYLEENARKIQGIFLTHGHADAIGALPYFIENHPVPVFGSELTIALAKIACENVSKAKKFNDFHIIDEQTEIDFDDVTVSFFKTTHSVPDSLGIVLQTPEGNIVYTGDFKIDQTATSDYQTDYSRIAEIGNQGVLALLSDSTNAENPIEIENEKDVLDFISETFEYHSGRIVVSAHSSNIIRIQQVFEAAYQNNRKIALIGYDVEKIVKTALRLNKLHIPDDDLLIDIHDIGKYDDDELVILQTGRSGEPLKSLQKMALGRHKSVKLKHGDLVLITTTPSPSMETNVAKTRDMIFRAGANVKTISDNMNLSGHASRNDLQLMFNLLKPKFVIPVQGEYRQLFATKECALEVGIPDENVILVNKGDILEYTRDKFQLIQSVDASNTLIDGIGIGDIGNIVLRDRKLLAEDGIFIAVVTIDRRKHKIVDTPKITSRGFVYVKTSRDLIAESREIVTKVVQNNLDNKEFDWTHLKQDIRDQLNHYLYEQTKRHPVIMPVIMEINQSHMKKGHKKVKKENVKQQKNNSKSKNK